MRALLLTLTLAIAGATAADDTPITKPIRYTWITTSCENWNCAAAAMVMANGDKHVIVLPTGQDSHPWLILKRVEEGSIFIPDEEPFMCEVFDGVDGAANHFGTLDSCRGPIMLNVPDGRAVVMSMKQCASAPGRRRAVN